MAAELTASRTGQNPDRGARGSAGSPHGWHLRAPGVRGHRLVWARDDAGVRRQRGPKKPMGLIGFNNQRRRCYGRPLRGRAFEALSSSLRLLKCIAFSVFWALALARVFAARWRPLAARRPRKPVVAPPAPRVGQGCRDNRPHMRAQTGAAAPPRYAVFDLGLGAGVRGDFIPTKYAKVAFSIWRNIASSLRSSIRFAPTTRSA